MGGGRPGRHPPGPDVPDRDPVRVHGSPVPSLFLTPAAHGWAGTLVESRISYPKLGSRRAAINRFQTPFAAQRSNRRHNLFLLPNRSGKSRQGPPAGRCPRTGGSRRPPRRASRVGPAAGVRCGPSRGPALRTDGSWTWLRGGGSGRHDLRTHCSRPHSPEGQGDVLEPGPADVGDVYPGGHADGVARRRR